LQIDPKNILIKDYTYVLPAEKIAQYPLLERDSSKLLIYNNSNISEDSFRNLSGHIPAGSLLVFNNTSVINARLKFKNDRDKEIEIFTLEPAEQTELSIALALKKETEWLCLVGNLKAWKSGTLISEAQQDGLKFVLKAELKSRQEDAFIVKLSWEPGGITFGEILGIFGKIPLPPYMKRDSTEEDSYTYQTVYSEASGSVAAPTAGLHFTQNVLNNIKEKGIESAFVTLHVGAGTFKPVKSPSLYDHTMHTESFYVSKDTIKQLQSSIGKNDIIAVGTTSMRTVESLYWFGVQLLQRRHTGNEISVSQWEPYNNSHEDAGAAISAVLQYMKQNGMKDLYGRTNIIIVPGYEFKMFSGLITNFHQPGSTLLLLVAAFIGEEWKSVYDYALKNDFRFLSYGDSSILFK
jgi:S-adenosylmethionine:tRNA ribosyltransferase-isomerase